MTSMQGTGAFPAPIALVAGVTVISTIGLGTAAL